MQARCPNAFGHLQREGISGRFLREEIPEQTQEKDLTSRAQPGSVAHPPGGNCGQGNQSLAFLLIQLPSDLNSFNGDSEIKTDIWTKIINLTYSDTLPTQKLYVFNVLFKAKILK